jgi:hypothetical protein
MIMPDPVTPAPLRQALQEARVEAAERSAVIVELRDAETARLAMLNDSLEAAFKDIPRAHADLFDRGVSGGTSPRLWIDAITHVAMGRDKRTYRLLTDTANGRQIVAEAADLPGMRDEITRYVARRIVQREQALAAGEIPVPRARPNPWIAFGWLLLGMLLGAGGMVALAWFAVR